MYLKNATLLGLAVLISACGQVNTDSNNHSALLPHITNAYIVPPVAGRPVTAGYFTVTNKTLSTFSIANVSAPNDSVSVMMHRTVALPDGIMQMQSIRVLDVKSGEQIAFAPGGYHLMLSGLSSSIDRLLLRFCDAQQRCIDHAFEVKNDA